MNPRRVAIVAYDGIQTLDLVGPADVLSAANDLSGEQPVPYEVVVLGVRHGPVASESGVRFYVDATLNEGGAFDTVIVPGGRTLRTDTHTRRLVARFVASQVKTARRIASVCTGIYALAEAGVLDGCRVTTHWRYAHDLRQRWPKLQIDADAIFVNHGKFRTSAGVTAGIDLALSFVEEDLGNELALAVAREIVVYLKRSGGQQQYSQPLLAQTQAHAQFGDLVGWIRSHLRDDLSLEKLAEHASLSPRHFARKFKETFRSTPADFVENLRLDEARWLLVGSGDSITRLASTVGYASDDTFRSAFERRFGVTPTEYRRRFSAGAIP